MLGRFSLSSFSLVLLNCSEHSPFGRKKTVLIRIFFFFMEGLGGSRTLLGKNLEKSFNFEDRGCLSLFCRSKAESTYQCSI